MANDIKFVTVKQMLLCLIFTSEDTARSSGSHFDFDCTYYHFTENIQKDNYRIEEKKSFKIENCMEEIITEFCSLKCMCMPTQY